MSTSTFSKTRGSAVLLLMLAVFALCYGCFHLLTSPSSADSPDPAHDRELSNERADDATGRVQRGWAFSEFAIDRLPEVIASGSWSVSENILRCNLELYDCEEVDFSAPEKGIKSVWVLSYYKGTAKYCCMRILTDSTSVLFVEKPSEQSNNDVGAAAPTTAPTSENSAALPIRDPVSIIRSGYAINLDHVPAHTGRPLPSDGEWSSHLITDKTVESEICGQDGATCSEVSYRVDALEITCTWIVAQSHQGWHPTILKPNPSAEFFFVHVRDF